MRESERERTERQKRKRKRKGQREREWFRINKIYCNNMIMLLEESVYKLDRSEKDKRVKDYKDRRTEKDSMLKLEIEMDQEKHRKKKIRERET